jgi:beta-lactamase regulating signal transducer with metallopeptidase domain
MNSLDYFNSSNFSNDIINGGGTKENTILDSALSIKNNAPIDTLLNYIEKDKPDASEVMMVSDEQLDLSKSLLEDKQQQQQPANNTSTVNIILIVIIVIMVILIIVSIIIYFTMKRKQKSNSDVKDKLKELSHAINDTYNNSSKHTNLSNSLLDENDSNNY